MPRSPVTPPTGLAGRIRVLPPSGWAAVVFVVTLAVYAVTAARETFNADVYGAGLEAWRVATTGAPWLDMVDQAQLWKGALFGPLTAPGAGGHLVVPRSPGVVLVAIPGYLLAGQGTAPADFSPLPTVFTAAVLGAVAVTLFFLAVSRVVPVPVALVGTGVLAFATPVWSVDGNALWTHAVTLVGITGMAWAAVRERWLLVGLFGSVALWGRLHTALIVAVVGLGVGLARRRPRITVQVGLVSVAGMGLASVWSHWMYGTWSPSGGYGASGYAARTVSGITGDLGAQLTNQLGLWVSPDRGLLVWTPVLVLLLPAVVRHWRDLPDWSRWLLVGGVVYTVAQGQLDYFMGGDGFYGYRLTLEMLACAAPAYLFSAHRAGAWARRLLGPVVGAQFAAISLGAVSEAWFLYREQAWSDNSLWLALRTEPALAAWPALCVLIGWLGVRAWQERRADLPAPRTVVPANVGGRT